MTSTINNSAMTAPIHLKLQQCPSQQPLIQATFSLRSKRFLGVSVQFDVLAAQKLRRDPSLFFALALIFARPKHRNLCGNPTETLATQARQQSNPLLPGHKERSIFHGIHSIVGWRGWGVVVSNDRHITDRNYIIFHPCQKRLNYDVNIKILDSRLNILTLNVKSMSNIQGS